MMCSLNGPTRNEDVVSPVIAGDGLTGGRQPTAKSGSRSTQSKTRGPFAGRGPRLVARTVRAPFRVGCRLRRHPEGDLGEGVFCRRSKKLGGLLLSSSSIQFNTFLLAKVGNLQVIGPLGESEMALDHDRKTVVEISLVAGDAGGELWHQNPHD